MKRTIGLIVNPVAGMGGTVGLKGTDGDSYKRAAELGAKPVTPLRTKDLFEHIQKKESFNLITAPGKMGESYVSDFNFATTVVGSLTGETSARDTKRIAEEMVSKGIDLLIFVGGDGTARDIYDAVGLKVPVVAVPSGVKVFSAVFAFNTRAAAEMVDEFIVGTGVVEQEVLDIDEAAFRDNRLAAKLYGYLLVPDVKKYLQGAKECSEVNASAVKSKEEVARYILEQIEDDALYLLGPGTTVKAIATAAGIPKTLLGVDALAKGQLVGTDLNERAILSLFNRFEKRYIIVTPIGGNGFIFGRGSKQFTPEVIRLVGRENVIIVGTRDKLVNLESLHVDTGDYHLDQMLAGYMQVTVGYKETFKMEVKG
ncbi:MAG: ATP-NAD kinase family protein [Sedimentisphaerales bacterium]|nr:ATP-NAD kinase family protein [Sedimentisphaerales bacterium]